MKDVTIFYPRKLQNDNASSRNHVICSKTIMSCTKNMGTNWYWTKYSLLVSSRLICWVTSGWRLPLYPTRGKERPESDGWAGQPSLQTRVGSFVIRCKSCVRRFSDFLNKTACAVIRSIVVTPTTRCHAIIVEWNEWKVKHPRKEHTWICVWSCYSVQSVCHKRNLYWLFAE